MKDKVELWNPFIFDLFEEHIYCKLQNVQKLIKRQSVSVPLFARESRVGYP